jgi:hypothetical protein
MPRFLVAVIATDCHTRNDQWLTEPALSYRSSATPPAGPARKPPG